LSNCLWDYEPVITVFNYKEKKIEFSFKHEHDRGVTQLIALNDSTIISSGLDGSIKTWNLANTQSKNVFSYLSATNNILLFN
jgi:hypothetical protein